MATITSTTTNETLTGTAGNDTYVFPANWGSDSLSDSGGYDTLDFSALVAALNIYLSASAGHEVTDGTNTLNWTGDIIEHVFSGSGNDTITGNSGSNWIDGGAGNDVINGGLGYDYLNGGDGNDTYIFEAGQGWDSIGFSNGSDWLDLSLWDTSTPLNFSLWEGHYENTITTNEADTIYGSHTANTIYASGGNDTISAANGNDVLVGGTGDDSLLGGNDNDTYVFENGFGHDTVSDSAHTDTLDFSQLTHNIKADLSGTTAIASGLPGNNPADPTQALLLFDGTNGSKAIKDLFGNSWTALGNANIQSASPWVSGEKYIDLDGSGDAIKSTAINPSGSDNFTIHFKTRFDSVNSPATVFLSGVANQAIELRRYSNFLGICISSNNSTWDIANVVQGTKSSWTTGQWYDIELSYSSTSGYRVFVDGVEDIHINSTTKMYNPGGIILGTNPVGSYGLDGGISDVYYTGNETLHTSNFTPLTSGYDSTLDSETINSLPGFDPNKSLLLFNNTDGSQVISDPFGNAWTANGDAQITSTNPWKAGEKSLVLDGSGDSLESNITPSGSNYTLRFRMRFDDTSQAQTVFCASNGASYEVILRSTGLTLYIDNQYTAGTKADFVDDQWYEFEFSYSSASGYRVFVDGQLDIYKNSTAPVTNPGHIVFGEQQVYGFDGPLYAQGALADVYYTGTETLHTSNFTPSTSGYDSAFITDSVTYSANSLENIIGGSGADSLTGSSSANQLTGGTGNDTLSGAAGNDIYKFSKSDGIDVINDASTSGDTADKIVLDSSVSQSEVAIWMNGSNLEIGYTSNSTDKITVQNQTTAANDIDRLELSTGYYLTDANINQVIQDMTTYAVNNSISLTSLNDVKNDAGLMAIVNGAWHT